MSMWHVALFNDTHTQTHTDNFTHNSRD